MRSRVEEEALQRLKPGPEEYERLWGFARRLASDLSSLLCAWLGCEPRVEGSLAKDTWLSGMTDVDVFLVFPKEYCLSLTTRRLIDYLRGVLGDEYSVELRYASHPYLRVGRGGLWADVVPACRIREGEEPLTPVDRTPLHTRYVMSVLRDWQRDEVRLLKAFLRSIGVYGAEQEVRGFSGYLAELLVAAYGSFRGVLEAAAEWRPPVRVAPPGTSLSDALSLRKRYPDAVMYVPDPVDPRRNAAAAVSLRSLATMTTASKLYLEDPLPELLNPRLEEDLEPPSPACHVTAILLTPPSPKPPDVLAGVAGRAARQAYNLLASTGFTPLDYAPATADGVAVALVAVLEDEAPRLMPRRGPPAWSRGAVPFTSKHLSGHARVWVAPDGRLYCLEPPRARSPEELLRRNPSWIPGVVRREGWRVTVTRGEEAAVLHPSIASRIAWFAAREPPWLLAVRMHRGRRERTSS